MKKLLLLLLASSSTVAFTQGMDVFLYGKLAMGVENDTYQNSTTPAVNGVHDYGSYFGLRGKETINDNIAAIWQIEQAVDLTAGQTYRKSTASGMIVQREFGEAKIIEQRNVLASRDSFVGLATNLGTIKAGYLSNYFNAEMGNVDIFNVGGFNSSRTAIRLPVAIGYYSGSLDGLSFAAIYSFNNQGQVGAGDINSGNANVSGNYSGGVYSVGAKYTVDNFALATSGQVWENVGYYNMGSGATETVTNANYNYAYVVRLEATYNNPEGLIAGAGMQLGNGIGYEKWANSGGAMGVWNNSGAITGDLTNNQYQTQELYASLGYHLGHLTPKIGYAYSNNIMLNGNLTSLALGNAHQIADTGYQQVLAEIDYDLSVNTSIFVGAALTQYGTTLQQITYGYDPHSVVDGTNQYQTNSTQIGLGLLHTF